MKDFDTLPAGEAYQLARQRAAKLEAYALKRAGELWQTGASIEECAKALGFRTPGAFTTYAARRREHFPARGWGGARNVKK